MEKTWQISGMTANWKMTVVAAEPDIVDPSQGPVEVVPDFDGLADHFRAVVDLAEAQWQLAQLG